MTTEQFDDDNLAWRVAHNAGNGMSPRVPRWVAVKKVTAYGTAHSKYLCRKFDLDPYEMVGNASVAESPDA